MSDTQKTAPADLWKTVDSVTPPPAAISTPDIPTQIGRYRIINILGEGGFGRVYLAHDDQLDRPVAIKVPRTQRQAEETAAYLAEARVIAGLYHPNIVPVYDAGTSPDGAFYVVSKVIEGSDLARTIRENPLTPTKAAELVTTIAEALGYAHGKHLVHRDIKPNNILLDASGMPFVADFGLALKEEDFGKGATFAGTPAYMSPEQARGEGHRVDGRSDIFSLGVVFYELLAGRRPFNGETLQELLEQITTVDARPLRQVNAAIPKELERICLKALAKRASERFTTAQDMADDLGHFLADAPTADQAAPAAGADKHETLTSTRTPASTPLTPSSDHRPIRIVPKGLRSFDAHDADFFLELLPGPRDRDQLPESIRFWKSRIEATDSDQTFLVGLIYGPSGCGKSSLVKAGLLPLLSANVLVVYIEASAGETETRLLHALRKRITGLPADLSLKETLAALRRGQGIPAGKKVLIVLDQFEQWLHKKDENTELVQALRQCDGERVQCIVMVRDDFWMAATRFMRELEIDLVPGRNTAAADLFDLRHAKKVLIAFGRAFGTLPENIEEISKEQKAFVEQAIAGLAQENKVICVRLALFAEMMKGRAWTLEALQEVGGTEGIGVTFLEETFSSAMASPNHRLHQKAARAVLKALLPASGANIKGHMRSSTELLEVSGYANRPKDFEDLIQTLDGEIRLITPSDEGQEARDEGQGNSSSLAPRPSPLASRYYQLTHDYLVPSLRDWLTRKEKETRRGRAELMLADRASVWNGRPENRQLPSLNQWLRIKALTQKKNWTEPQRKMMRQAGRYHFTQSLAFAVVLALVGWSGYEAYGTLQARALRDTLLIADTIDVPAIVPDVAHYHRWINPLLREAYKDVEAKKEPRQQLNLSLALLPSDPSQVEHLYGRLLEAGPRDVPVLRDALLPHKEELLDRLWSVMEQPTNTMDGQRLRAACALAVYDPTSPRWVKTQDHIAHDLVANPAVYLAIWIEALRPVRAKLLAPLGVVFRDAGRREAERFLAADILADYAGDRPQELADLLMDADTKQFSVLFPKVQSQAAAVLPLLSSEVRKKPYGPLLKNKGTIAKDDPRVQIVDAGRPKSEPAKLFLIALQANKKYTMTMDSAELDACLLLQDPLGKQLAIDIDGGGDLNARLDIIPPQDGVYKLYATTIQGIGAYTLTVFETDANETLAKRQANAAIALLRLGQPTTVWPLLKHRPDPRVRSDLIHRLGPLGAPAGVLLKQLDDEPDVTIRRALVLSLGEFAAKKFTPAEQTTLVKKLQDLYLGIDDPGLRAAADWLLRRWKQDAWLTQQDESLAADKEQRTKKLERIRLELAKGPHAATPQWYITGQGQTMVVLPGPIEFLMGSPVTEAGRLDERQHLKRIGRSFAVAAKPVTMEQMLRFRKDEAHVYLKRNAPTDDCPVNGTTWFEAAAYCNWLSEQEGIPKTQWCYETDAQGNVTKLKPNYLSLTGYRLPSEAEMEYACRAGAETSRYYGESPELLGKYGWYVLNSAERTWPVGSLKPNDFGLFDMHGNVWCWCQETLKPYPKTPSGQAIDDVEDHALIKEKDARVLRGGSFFVRASDVRAAHRYGDMPTFRLDLVGIRPARTIASRAP